MEGQRTRDLSDVAEGCLGPVSKDLSYTYTDEGIYDLI